MPVLSFANAKGGAGKTTAALLLATELAERGNKVCVIDADPQRWITQWANMPGKPVGISIIDQVSPATIGSVISEELEYRDYVIVDLEGANSLLVSTAIGLSDMVLIPIQGCAMDAKGGGKILDLIAQMQRAERRLIRHAVILTRINAAVTTRALRAVREHLKANKIDVLKTPIVERAAFRDIFDTGGTLRMLDRKTVSNLDKALANVSQMTQEIMACVPAAKPRASRSFYQRLWRRAA